MPEEHLTDEELADAIRSSEIHEKRLAYDLAEQQLYTRELRRLLAERAQVSAKSSPEGAV
jgi:Arc/MetJ family transcription regulator